MATPSPSSHAPLPEVRLELRNSSTLRSASYLVSDDGFLIGSVPGCDLRLSGADTATVLCLISRRPGAAHLRKLATSQPLLVNGRAVNHCDLQDGDRVVAGPVELVVHVQPGSVLPEAPVNEVVRREFQEQLDEFRQQVLTFDKERQIFLAKQAERERVYKERLGKLAEQERRLKEQADELEANRGLWDQRGQEIEEEYRRRAAAGDPAVLELREAELKRREEALDERERRQAPPELTAAVADQQSLLSAGFEEVERQKQELNAARAEVADIRRQLYERYREKRDRLAGLQQAVDRAAQKVQERKRQHEADLREAESRRHDEADRRADLDARFASLNQERQRFAEDREQFEKRQRQAREELDRHREECQAREDKLIEERQALEVGQREHQAALVRLDRQNAALEERERQLIERTQEFEQRMAGLRRDSQDLEQQVVELDEWRTRLHAEAERVAQERSQYETASRELSQRTAAVEGQQAMLASLRTRLERMREEVRRDEQQLAERRARQETAEEDLQKRLSEAQKLREQLDQEETGRAEERRQMSERSATLEAAVAQLRQAQEALARDQEEARRRTEELDRRTAEFEEQSSRVQAREAQLAEEHQRLEAERQQLRERTEAVSQGEETRAALQEQLRRRAEELATRQKALAEQAAQYEARSAALEARHAEIEREHQQAQERLAGVHEQLDANQESLAQQIADLDRQRLALLEREQQHQRNLDRLKEAGRKVAEARKALADERAQADGVKQEFSEAEARARADFEALRREAVALQQQLPEQELHAGAVLDRLAAGREQLSEHLNEIHTYARQCQEDLETARAEVQRESERVWQGEQALRRGQHEHRLAMAAFRQQLIDWQGKVAEMKRLLARGETRLERKQAEVDERARQVGETSERLARQAVELETQQRQVAERRQNVDRHLRDMQEWYRNKLRELAGERDAARPGKAAGDPAPELNILSLLDKVDPGDRQLGELLQSLDLVENDTLSALLHEARRQRRSLRQVLLASGAVTLYQMALIEAGNVDGLVLGPVRVVDRLRVTPHETVYRVFDPRRGREAVLRHLAESEMLDAVRPDEFRERFRAAVLAHPNVAATLEVLDIGGRPAALQEWLVGLPSTEWPPLAAVPGVWYRLLCQAALGLHTAHQAALVHGQLSASQVVLTTEGIVKICGLGEPPWLSEATEPGEPSVADDLQVLGQIATYWISLAVSQKKTKPLPEPLSGVARRLNADNPEERYASAAELLDELDRVAGEVPANTEAWERMLRHVREHATGDGLLRQSA